MSHSRRQRRRSSSQCRRHSFRVALSDDELAAIRARSRACGRTAASFVRESALGAIPRSRRDQATNDLVHQLGAIARTLSALRADASATCDLTGPLADLRSAIADLVKKTP